MRCFLRTEHAGGEPVRKQFPGNRRKGKNLFPWSNPWPPPFKQEFGTLYCRELLGLSPERLAAETARPGERTAAYYASRPCERCIAFCAPARPIWKQKPGVTKIPGPLAGEPGALTMSKVPSMGGGTAACAVRAGRLQLVNLFIGFPIPRHKSPARPGPAPGGGGETLPACSFSSLEISSRTSWASLWSMDSASWV